MVTDCCFLTQVGDGGAYSCYPELPWLDADEASLSLTVWLARRVVPCHNCNLSGRADSAQMCSPAYQPLGCPDPEFVVAKAFGDGVRFSIGPSDVRPRRAESCHRCEMKNLNFAAELHLKLGAPATGTVESLRLLRAFLKLAPRQRFEVIRLVEDLVTDETLPEHPVS